MIATSIEFWRAFFNSSHPKHMQARNEVVLFDKEKIVVPEPVFSEVITWLLNEQKHHLIEWFVEYVENTSNVRIFFIGKEEFGCIVKLCQEQHISFAQGCLAYLQKYLRYDITDNY